MGIYSFERLLGSLQKEIISDRFEGLTNTSKYSLKLLYCKLTQLAFEGCPISLKKCGLSLFLLKICKYDTNSFASQSANLFSVILNM